MKNNCLQQAEASLIAYWQQLLLDAPPLLSLPTDRPRPALPTFRGSSLSLIFSQNLTTAICDLSKQEKVSIFVTLLAAFNILIYRYTNSEDIVVGALNGERAREQESENSSINTLIIRTQPNGNPSFQELLHRVKDTTESAYTHQNLPLEKLLEVLPLQRDLSYSPIFQVMFVFAADNSQQNIDLSLVNHSSVQESCTTKLDLTLCLEQASIGLVGKWEYNTDLFDRRTIERMSGHFQTLLEGIVTNLEQPISRLPLLTTDENNQLLVEWNQTQLSTSYNCIHQLFEEQVERSPLAIAVVFEDQQLTYAQLNSRANQLAHYLRSLGVGPEVLVGICLERSLEMVIGLLGILKAGGAYVPLDPSYPTERLVYMLSDAAMPVLLTQQSLLAFLPAVQAQIVCLDTDYLAISQHSQANCLSGVNPENLAYVIYTSGSTGKPKGVQISHGSVVNFLISMSFRPGLTSTDTFNAVTTISFDIAALELYLTLMVGAKLVVVPREIAIDGNRLLSQLRESGATVMQATPATWQMLLVAGLSSQELLGMKILCGGEALPSQLADQLREKGAQLWNLYGPTETTIWSTVYQVGELSKYQGDENAAISIGRPIANTQIYILDPDLLPVPIGVLGELHIGGAGLSRGYLNRPELTAEKFIAHPWDCSQKIYKTGDLARYLPDGNIEYVGRIDNQVKIRGFRIELGEIESVLLQHPAISQGVVIAYEKILGDKRLVAYTVSHQGQTPTTDDLRQFISQNLPSHMIPSAFIFLERLPLTPNGKVNRRALPIPNASNWLIGTNFTPPRNSIEEVLADIWGRVLGLERVGIDDNFFEMGGHSLLAIKVTSICSQVFSSPISLRQLFETPTIAALGLAIAKAENQKTGDNSSAYQVITQRDNQESAPLSFAQKRLWFLHQLEPKRTDYHICTALHLYGYLNVTALQQSLDTIVVQHEILRTNYIDLNGEPIQVIRSPQPVELALTDLQACPSEKLQDKIELQLSQENQLPFNLSQDLMLRGKLLKIAGEEHILLLVIHHIAFDGWSLDILAKQLEEFYTTFCSHLDSAQPEKPALQYADFAVWEQKYLKDEDFQASLAYYKQQLADAPLLLSLPTDRPRPAVQTFRGASQSFSIPQEITAGLKSLSSQEGVTIFMTLLAAFNILLYRYTSSEDIVIGSPIANRNRSEIEGLIGFFVNTLVLRTNVSGKPSFQELLRRVREVAMSAYFHQSLPFERLVEELRPKRDLSYSSLFQVMFVFDEDVYLKNLQLPNLKINPWEINDQTTKFDLTLFLERNGEELIGKWQYNTDLFDATTIERMNRHFHNLLLGIIANPAQPITELPLLAEDERHQLLVEWNRTQTVDLQDRCIHQLFEEQVERDPNAVALVFEQQQLTYQELNSRANQLANYLRHLGVGPEFLVGIYLERSLEVVVAILGILKAGGAYLALDSTYPLQRISFMMEDAQVKVILTQQELVNKLGEQLIPLVCLDTDWHKIAQADVKNLQNRATLTNLIYVIFTSGSTGKAKGVAIEHGQLLNYLNGIQARIFSEPGGRFALVSTFAADLGNTVIFPCLSSGGCLHILSKERISDPNAFLEYCEQNPFDYLKIVPSHLLALLSIVQSETKLPWRKLILGGEATSWNLIEKVQHHAPDCQIFNHYGPTETTVGVLTFKVESQPISHTASHTQTVPLGRPLANTQIYLLDRHLQLLPIGIPGELHIGGAGLARGYLNRPDINTEKFISHPFSDDPNARLYKTSDLARYLEDGNIEYLGRIDNQVKIRGFRIELGEIETVLSQHPAIEQVIVMAVVPNANMPSEKRLIAYIVPYRQESTNTAELRLCLKVQLPDHMVPSTFVILESFPLTSNGKIDRNALLAINYTEQDTETEESFLAPRDAWEMQLTKIWQQLLGVKSVGVRDNFFELGGHSLMAVRLFAEIYKTWQKRLPLATLFQKPTIEELANVLRQDEWSAPWSSLVLIQPGRSKLPLFCIHPVGGNVLEYRTLAQYLGKKRPIYGLQPIGLDSKQTPFTRVEDIAEHYTQEISAILPSGPYFILGYSFGGVVAFEIARKLHAQGKKVGLLGILDSVSPTLPLTRTSLAKFLQVHWHNLRQLNTRERFLYIQDWAKWYLNNGDYNGILVKELSKYIQVSDAIIKVIESNMQAAQAYRGQVYPGKATLFRSLIQSVKLADFVDLGWSDLVTGGLEIQHIPGNHNYLLKEPYVKVLAERLDFSLQQAESNTTTSELHEKTA